jgi:hypothetical protein
MPFSVGARSCPGMKIGFSVAEVLLKEMAANIDVFIPHGYVHTRSLRGGARFYVRKTCDLSEDTSLERLAFIQQAQAHLGLAHKSWLKFRDFSVNFELACSQLLPKRLVVSFQHQSKFKSLFLVSARLIIIFLLVQLITIYIFPKDIV